MKHFFGTVFVGSLTCSTLSLSNHAQAEEVVPFRYSEARKLLQATVDFEGPMFDRLMQSSPTSGYRAGGVQFGIAFEHTQERYQGPLTVAPNVNVVPSKSRSTSAKGTGHEGLFGIALDHSRMLTTRKSSKTQVNVKRYTVIDGKKTLISSGLENRSYDWIGRGSNLVFSFEADQFLVGFQLREFDTTLPNLKPVAKVEVGRIYYIRLFRRDGTLLADFRIPIRGNQYVAFQRCVGIRDIAGVWVSAKTPTGFAIDNVIYDSEPTEVTLEVKEQLEPCVGLTS